MTKIKNRAAGVEMIEETCELLGMAKVLEEMVNYLTVAQIEDFLDGLSGDYNLHYDEWFD